MKKAVKVLIAASAVAAVVGAGTVSFAMWSGEGSPTATVEGSMATINTVGSVTVSPEKVTNALYPLNEAPSGGSDYWEFTVTVTGTGTFTTTVKGEFPAGTNAQLFYSQDEDRPTDADHNISSAKEIDPSKKVYIYMTAFGSNAMNAKITLTFEASAANTE